MNLKNKTTLLLLCLCSIAGGFKSAAIRFDHQIKRIVFRNGRYNAVAPVEAKDGAAVFTASSLDRIFQDGKTLLKPSFSTQGFAIFRQK